MQIEQLPIDQLTPYARNSRTHSKQATLEASGQTFDQVRDSRRISNPQ